MTVSQEAAKQILSSVTFLTNMTVLMKFQYIHLLKKKEMILFTAEAEMTILKAMVAMMISTEKEIMTLLLAVPVMTNYTAEQEMMHISFQVHSDMMRSMTIRDLQRLYLKIILLRTLLLITPAKERQV